MRTLSTLILVLLWSGAQASTEKLAATANSFLASLNSEQQATVSYPLKDDARATWSNLPVIMSPPAGIMLDTLTDTQRQHVHHLLQLSLSSQGYGKAHSIMWLDDILREIEQAEIDAGEDSPIARTMVKTRSSGQYAVAIFGSPDDKNWGWKITGHHLAVNVTVANGQVALTPGFWGSNPRVVSAGPYAGFAPLSGEYRLSLTLFNALTDAQQKEALIPGELPQDVVEGPGRRGSLTKFEGLSSAKLNADQMLALQHLVSEYVRNGNSLAAGEHLDSIAAAGWKNLWFSWRGPTDGSGPFYYRVHGPRLLIEYHLQNMNHDHAVIRDPENDYGEDWLGLHYKEEHPTLQEALQILRRAAGIE